MKTFLTICTSAMFAAGIYGFTDMAIDVKNGTMIQYDHGDGEETEAISTAAVTKKMRDDKKVAIKEKAPEAQAIKKESTATTKVKTKKNPSTSSGQTKKMKAPVVESPVQETVVVEEAQSDVKVDSAPQEIILEREYDYREFSRGAPRKHKKSKKSKKD
jgi:hypothetical protein